MSLRWLGCIYIGRILFTSDIVFLVMLTCGLLRIRTSTKRPSNSTPPTRTERLHSFLSLLPSLKKRMSRGGMSDLVWFRKSLVFFFSLFEVVFTFPQFMYSWQFRRLGDCDKTKREVEEDYEYEVMERDIETRATTKTTTTKTPCSTACANRSGATWNAATLKCLEPSVASTACVKVDTASTGFAIDSTNGGPGCEPAWTFRSGVEKWTLGLNTTDTISLTVSGFLQFIREARRKLCGQSCKAND